MALWDWTLQAYSQDGVPEACLILQDSFGQNTTFLLWAVWAEASDPAVLARAADVARRWEETTLAPIRSLRRELKSPFLGIDAAAREALREDVKAVELRAERVLMESLEANTTAQDGAPALTALEAASKAWGKPAPAEALAALAVALG